MKTTTIESVIASLRERTHGTYPFFIAVEGRSAVGKSTISKRICEELHDVTVIDQDDFYIGGSYDQWLRWSVAERADKTIDWQRLKREVLVPLRSGETARWHPFDWNEDGISIHMETAKPSKYIIVEGTYSARKELRDFFDATIFVTLDQHERQRRLLNREGDGFSARWNMLWEEAENYYFDMLFKKEDATFVIDTMNQE